MWQVSSWCCCCGNPSLNPGHVTKIKLVLYSLVICQINRFLIWFQRGWILYFHQGKMAYHICIFLKSSRDIFKVIEIAKTLGNHFTCIVAASLPWYSRIPTGRGRIFDEITQSNFANYKALESKLVGVQRSGIDTIKYHTRPRIPMGKSERSLLPTGGSIIPFVSETDLSEMQLIYTIFN